MEDKNLKFVCKLCNKKYPCGKSLGGHMRSHVTANSAESDRNFDCGRQFLVKESGFTDFLDGQSSYGLRENPKKTWRAVDSSFPLPQEKVCKQCGKTFQSMKALCGHMACHSDKDKLELDSYSDNENGDRMVRTRSSKSDKRYDKIIFKSPMCLADNNDSSSVSEVDLQEQEEVAICLMLLSMDSVYKDCVNSVVECSDNNSVTLETKSSSIDLGIGTKECLNNVNQNGDMKVKDGCFDGEIPPMENSDSGYFLDECGNVESDTSVDRFYGDGKCKEYGARFRKKMDKITCYKPVFKKETTIENGYDYTCMASNSVRVDSKRRMSCPENLESQSKSCKKMKSKLGEVEAANYPQQRNKYECLNCKRSFNSYHALGGHRPCHKRSNESEINVNNPDYSTDFRKKGHVSSECAERIANPRKNKGHVCPFCRRVFKNGQALGGHKRTHFIGARMESAYQNPVTKPKLLDLNLPAPEETEEDGHCRPVLF
ncbi:uncharacterized protein [Henckelia pumila]|uniref:uncharacterized protein n=1 Tax=Henckelia pumila TaxID=405737 RepID=UPI003C6E891A